MLSRIANNLFWLGRYIKRTEQISRFIEAEFYSALDAPKTYQKDLALLAILKMTGSDARYFENYSEIDEKSIFFHTLLDKENPVSTISSLTAARYNSKSTRDIMPDDIWEKINFIYHNVSSYNKKQLKNELFYEVNREVIDHMLIVQSLIDTLITRKEKWMFLKAGIHLEAAFQMTRIIRAKIYEIETYKQQDRPATIENYQWTTLSKCYGDIDIFKKPIKASIIKEMILENLLLNHKSPTSLAYRVKELYYILESLGSKRSGVLEECEFLAGKLSSKIRYTKIDDIFNDKILDFLDAIEDDLQPIGSELEKRYFG